MPMTISTRSQVMMIKKSQNESNENKKRTDDEEEESQMAQNLKNPYHGLKSKMKALTLIYGQQKQAAIAQKHLSLTHEEPRFSSHPSVDLIRNHKRVEKKEEEIESIRCVMKENFNPNSKLIRNFVIPNPSIREIGKENTAAVADGGGGDDQRITETAQGNCSRIQVFVRLRPMSKQEIGSGSRCCVKIENNRDVYLTEFANENDYLRLKRVKGRHFSFDASFADSAAQSEVYSSTAEKLVEAVLLGKNGSIFCYGATGAGKTYTMLGTVENPGVMVLAIKDLFNKFTQRNSEGNYAVKLSYLEVYNETVRDLLSPGKRALILREDKQGIIVSGLTEYEAFTADEVMALLHQGNQNRITEPTRANETSSRSHAILQVTIEYKTKDASSNNITNKIGKLSLIDLAGSERALATEQRTLRSFEGANINRSLLALSSCINALVLGRKHVPYRDSKLTQLLKDSLGGGGCNTVMIANVSPSDAVFGETQNTLHWADRAKKIKIKAGVSNEEIQVPDSKSDRKKLLLKLQKENRELKTQLARLKQTVATAANSTPSSPPFHEKRKAKSSNLFSGNCFNSPDSKRKEADETVLKLQKTVQALKTEMKRMKKAHDLEIKQKDDLIRELNKIQSNRVSSPDPRAKKRSFWGISNATSPR